MPSTVGITACVDGISPVTGESIFRSRLWIGGGPETSGNGILASIDISGNQALKTLEVKNNQLTALSLGGNPGLEKLDCQKNLLTGLDLTENLLLNKLYCNNNANLTTVWVSAGHTFLELSKDDHTTIQYVSSGDGGKSEGYNRGSDGQWD